MKKMDEREYDGRVVVEWKNPVALMEELAHQCKKVEDLCEEFDHYRPVRGKDHLWVEHVGEAYFLYWRENDRWFAAAYDDVSGRFLGAFENDEPFDYRSALGGL